MRFLIFTIATLITCLLAPGIVAAQDKAAERLEAMRALRDRPFGSTGTGSILGTSGIDSAFGTPGSFPSGVGRGSAVQAGGPDASVLPVSDRTVTDLSPLGRAKP
jgi:hypothetical protein